LGLKSNPRLIGSFEITLQLSRNAAYYPLNSPTSFVQTIIEETACIRHKGFFSWGRSLKSESGNVSGVALKNT
jgi:hypothetical protein